MGILNAAELLKPIPIETVDKEIDGVGTVRIRQISLADMNKNDAWQRPGGVPNKWRIENNRWKLVAACLVDEAGRNLFDFPDTKSGNEAFKEFVETIGNGGIGHWNDIRYEVLVVNGWIKEVEDEPEADLLGK